jgi:hypothetical protein
MTLSLFAKDEGARYSCTELVNERAKMRVGQGAYRKCYEGGSGRLLRGRPICLKREIKR